MKTEREIRKIVRDYKYYLLQENKENITRSKNYERLKKIKKRNEEQKKYYIDKFLTENTDYLFKDYNIVAGYYHLKCNPYIYLSKYKVNINLDKCLLTDINNYDIDNYLCGIREVESLVKSIMKYEKKLLEIYNNIDEKYEKIMKKLFLSDDKVDYYHNLKMIQLDFIKADIIEISKINEYKNEYIQNQKYNILSDKYELFFNLRYKTIKNHQIKKFNI